MSFDVDEVLAGLSLEQKAALTSGADFWHTKSVPGAPAIMLTDGPHGIRKQEVEGGSADLGRSVPATCFPTAAALGSSWDRDLLRRVGAAIGREARALDVAVVLGPGLNIKRSPLCGRNFEYVSEDPVVAGELGAALVDGLQGEGVGASVKHFAANNQETDRMRVSADVDERTLREIYLPAFERVVTRAKPWTVMCAYNKVNGTFASEHRWLLTDVLRDEWGFDGLVMSDWGAVHDRVAALRAGLDLQMPSAGPAPDAAVVGAVRDGSLDESVLDKSARRVLALAARATEGPGEPFDVDAHHALAREAAAAGTVLLRNEPVEGEPVLPLASLDGVLVVGELARTPRYQGSGSSQVVPTRLDDALSALPGVAFEPGYVLPGGPAGDDDALRAAAVAAAREARTVVVFVGLPGVDESEGYDRTAIDLPATQLATLTAVADVCERVVVVLANGGAVAVSGWRDRTAAILETWLGGQATGGAVADVLLGRVNPSARLTETIPHRLEDTPAFGAFPGELGHVRYGEGVLVGYRWFDARDADVAYPFGHGLSYTTFEYGDVTAAVTGSGADAAVEVRVNVTNTGGVDGAEVVQVYVGDPESAVLRPVRELKAFERVVLAAGESQEVVVRLDARDLAYWHTGLGRWVVEGGEFVVSVGASSRDLRGSVSVDVEGEPLHGELSAWSTLHEWLTHPVGGPILREQLSDGTVLDEASAAMALEMPLKVIADFRVTPVTPENLEDLVRAARTAR